MNPVLPLTYNFHPQSELSNERKDEQNLNLPKFVPYSSPSSILASENSAFTVVTEINNFSNSNNTHNNQNNLPNLTNNTITTNLYNTNIPNNLQKNLKKISYKTKRIFKVIIVGDAYVGKTCLSFRFCNGRFPVQTKATIGVDFRERSLIIDEELIRVQLWDTAGQERYRQSIVSHYYRNVDAVVFVYDVTNVDSFKSLSLWIDECRKNSVNSKGDTPHILIGNKCDLQLSSERVKTERAQIFADENDMALFETSALADSEADHVESIFMTLVYKLRQCKPMHVQTIEERQEKNERLLIKAEEAAKHQQNESYCC